MDSELKYYKHPQWFKELARYLIIRQSEYNGENELIILQRNRIAMLLAICELYYLYPDVCLHRFEQLHFVDRRAFEYIYNVYNNNKSELIKHVKKWIKIMHNTIFRGIKNGILNRELKE